MSSNTSPSIGIVGGTGDLGRGLALRLAKAGHAIWVGSRKADQAIEAADALKAELASRGVAEPTIEGMDNVAAAERGDGAAASARADPAEVIDRYEDLKQGGKLAWRGSEVW